jgi:hypothetical protein
MLNPPLLLLFLYPLIISTIALIILLYNGKTRSQRGKELSKPP